jgi:hypothetical protein
MVAMMMLHGRRIRFSLIQIIIGNLANGVEESVESYSHSSYGVMDLWYFLCGLQVWYREM